MAYATKEPAVGFRSGFRKRMPRSEKVQSITNRSLARFSRTPHCIDPRALIDMEFCIAQACGNLCVLKCKSSTAAVFICSRRVYFL